MAILSTESIAGVSPTLQGTGEQCASCASPMAADQRYCLECGERRATVSDFLRAGPPRAATPPAPPGMPPPGASADGAGPRSSTLSLIAGVGVLLLAMGVGVLIGRSGGSARQSAAPAEVVTVGSSASGGASGAGAEESFSDDWPSGTKGYTVQLQTLPQTGTTVAAVQQAKSGASAKGASAVGALKSEDFASLQAGSYVIYSGVYHKRGEAQKALGALQKKFPGAKVIEVSETGSGSSAAGSGGSNSSGGGAGATPKHPAPPGVLEGLSHAKGKSYEEKSKNLPDVVSTG